MTLPASSGMSVRFQNALVRFMTRFIDSQPKPHTGVITNYIYDELIEIQLDDLPNSEDNPIVFRHRDNILFLPAEDTHVNFLRRVNQAFRNTKRALDDHAEKIDRNKLQFDSHKHPIGSHHNAGHGDTNPPDKRFDPTQSRPYRDMTKTMYDSMGLIQGISETETDLDNMTVDQDASKPERLRDNLDPYMKVGDKVALLPISVNKYLVIRLRNLP